MKSLLMIIIDLSNKRPVIEVKEDCSNKSARACAVCKAQHTQLTKYLRGRESLQLTAISFCCSLHKAAIS